ncbi:MAG: type II secretion system F family protein [Bacteroidetes bacterium]|nr:type II secretion system F family protein [Bacteroidota bacterium]
MSFKLNQHSISVAPAKTANQSAGKKENFFNRDIQLFGGSFNDKKKERFYMDLRILLMAGIDLKSALELIIEEQPKEKDKAFFSIIYDDVIKGKSLAEALRSTGKFSEYEFFSIEIGEESNKLHDVLEELMNYYADQAALKKQIMSVLSYPAFVFVITIGLVYFMLTSVVPMFADVFKQFGSELPPLTLKVIAISENFPFYAMIGIIIILGAGLFVYWQKNETWFRQTTSAFFLKVPKVGQLIKLVYLARFTQAMHLLLASKTPLVHSLELTERMIKFYPLQKAIEQMRTDVTKGKSLHSGMSAFSIFPKRMLSLIKVGEEVNQLEVMLGKLSKQYNEELKYQTNIIGKIMEPLILLIIGCIVGVILVAMYMPMFNLSNLMAQ